MSRGSAPSRGKVGVKMETAGCVPCLEHRSRMGQVTQTLMGYSKTRALPFTQSKGGDFKMAFSRRGTRIGLFSKAFPNSCMWNRPEKDFSRSRETMKRQLEWIDDCGLSDFSFLITDTQSESGKEMRPQGQPARLPPYL